MSLQRSDILGRIITLQSVRYNGSYADCHHSKKLCITECNYTDLPSAEWTRLFVHEVNDDTIVLESVRYRNHYVDAHHSKQIHLTHSPNPPVGHKWAQWRLENVSGSVYALKSNRFPDSYLDSHHSRTARVTQGSSSDEWAQWSLGIGPTRSGEAMIKDQYEEIFSSENKTDVSVELTYKRMSGVMMNTGTSAKMSASMGFEISTNLSLGPFSASSRLSIEHSSEWSTSSEETWSEGVESQAKVDVPPNKKVLISQLTATYGPYIKIYSEHIRFEQEDVDPESRRS